jgi:hypothetical protein
MPHDSGDSAKKIGKPGTYITIREDHFYLAILGGIMGGIFLEMILLVLEEAI